MSLTKSSRRSENGVPATLHQVAELAGVHPMTVSRALKGSSSVAQATRENIQRIAQELNYTPNAAARALVMGKTETIAVVTGRTSEHYYAHVLYLLETEITASDYKLLVLRSRDINQDLLSLVNTNVVDGVIAVDAFPRINDLTLASGRYIPACVYAGAARPEWVNSLSIDAIKIDLRQGVQQALKAMLDTGCRRVAYVISSETMGRGAETRSREYNSAMDAAGFPSEIINLEVGGKTSVHSLVRERLVEYINERGCPDGLLCQNDEIAMASYRALRDSGFRVPDDTQIVGCDGLHYMDDFDPQLSTIVQPAEQMCAMAWQFLQLRMRDAQAPRQQATLDAHLRIRPSLKIFNAAN